MAKFDTATVLFSVTLISLMSLAVVGENAARSEDSNMIVNPGFEEVLDNQPLGWEMFGDAQRVTDEVNSGTGATRVRGEGESAGVRSDWFQFAPHSRIAISAWMKAENVVNSGSYFELRLTLSAYDSDQATRIEWWDIVSTHGSFDWKQVGGSVIVPPGTAYLRLSAQLTNSSGTFWIDDVEARSIQSIPELEIAQTASQLIIPQPWRMSTTEQIMRLGSVSVSTDLADLPVIQAIEHYFRNHNITYQVQDSGNSEAEFSTLLILGDRNNEALADRLQMIDSGDVWDEIGDQGYFLSIDADSQPSVIYVGANSEQGRFYGFQTLKQLINQDGNSVRVADIVDRPTLNRRGIVMGFHWFDLEQDEAFSRLAELKLNFIWTQGTFLNQKFWYRWRDPLTRAEQEAIRSYVQAAHQNFVVPYIAIGPRGEDLANPTIYSSETEINLLVNKMEVLYSLGVRNFGLAFDDLANSGQGILFGADIEIFNDDIGEAHLYFINEVYQRMRSQYDDINLMVVPMIYSRVGNVGDQDITYLQTLGALPTEIEFISAPDSLFDIETAARATNRQHIIWDNYWASFYGGELSAPELVVPLNRPASLVESGAPGYMFLPLIPDKEDASLVSWRTAADYAWTPDRYSPETSFQAAARQYLAEL